MKAVGSIVGALVALGGPLLAGLGAVVLLGACASCQSTVRQASIPAVAGSPIDGAAFDSRDRRLYLADQKNHGVAVVDMSSSTPQYLRTIDTTSTPIELAFAPQDNRLYASLTGGTVAAIDTRPTSQTYLEVVARIAVAATSADWLDYDAATHQLLVSTATDGQVVSINTSNNGIHAVYPVGLPVGQARYVASADAVYVTVPTADAVYRMRASDGVVTRKFVIKGCRPEAMGINSSASLALVGCRGSIGILDLGSGASTVTRMVQGADAITYDAASDRFAVGSPHETKDSAVGVFAGDGQFIGSVGASPTTSHAVFDDARGVIVAPTAAGLLSLNPGACLPPPNWLKFAGSVSVFAIPLAAAALFLVMYARRVDRPKVNSEPQPTFRDLQREDLALERERMRAFEDSILGPELSPEP